MTVLSGYSTTSDFWATKFSQAGLEQLTLHVTIHQITSGFIQRPNPSRRLDTNRAIKPAHAEDFASYLIKGAEDDSGKWSVVVPPLLVYISPLAVDFTPSDEHPAIDDIQFGIARLDKTEPLEIWDGQHRTLGAYRAVERVNKELSDAVSQQAQNPTEERDARVARLRKVRRRLGAIVVPVSIALETSKDRIAQLFADVADNAKGINATALARLDQRNVFNRVAAAIFESRDDWRLLEGLIDDDNASLSQNSQYWTTYRDVAAVAQTAWVGYGARWTPRKEETEFVGVDQQVLANVREFYEALAEAFPELDDVFSEALEPKELRGGGSHTSLLASSTTVRALASAWHDLRWGHRWTKAGARYVSTGYNAEKAWGDEDIVAAFKALPSMKSKSGDETALDPFWKDLGVVGEPYAAPTARAGNVRTMSVAIVEHADKTKRA
jgi:hypothetical protein